MKEFADNDMLARIVAGIETTPQTTEEVKASLKGRGYNPDADLVSFKTRLSKLVTKHTWKEVAQAKQCAFNRRASTMSSWATKTVEEIDSAFQRLLKGEFGNAADSQFALAFRNLETITHEDKIAILDGLELLNDDDSPQKNPADR